MQDPAFILNLVPATQKGPRPPEPLQHNGSHSNPGVSPPVPDGLKRNSQQFPKEGDKQEAAVKRIAVVFGSRLIPGLVPVAHLAQGIRTYSPVCTRHRAPDHLESRSLVDQPKR